MADRTPRRVSEGDRLLRTLFDYIDRRIRELLPFVTPEGKLNLNSRDIVGQLPGKSGGTSGSVGVSIRGARDYDDRVAPATGQAIVWDGLHFHPATVSGGSGASLPWFNVKDYGATGDGTTDDTAAISSAIAALHAAGRGVLYCPAGTYKTSGGFTLAAPCLVLGDGMAPTGAGSLTAIQCDSATAALFTVTAPGADFRDLELWNTAATTPTAGAAIVVSNATISPRVNYDHVEVYRFYDNWDVQVGDGWAMRGCVSADPVRYGVRVRNTLNADTGDWMIADSTLWGSTYGAAALLRLESSGGGKIINCKCNGQGARPARAIDVDPVGTTSILLIGNCSIENYSGDGIHLAGGGWDDIVIHGCEFGQYSNGTGHAIAVSSLDDVIVDACVFRSDSGPASAVSLVSVARAYIGAATNNGFGVVVSQSGSVGVIDLSGGAPSVPDATATVKGILQLAGDLAGTAASPALATLSPSPAGTYTLATVTVDGKGRVTAAADGTARGSAWSIMTDGNGNIVYAAGDVIDVEVYR